MKVLITGANGYLGQGIMKNILDLGMDGIAVDVSTEHVDKRAVKITCNLFEAENPYEKFGKPDILLHLAWRDGFVHYADSHIEDLPKHYKFIKAMVCAGVKKVVVMGSMHEVGFFEGSIKEDTPCHPVTPYGISKNALRELTNLLCQKNKTIFQWLRGYYIVGNSTYGSSVFSKIAAAAQEHKKDFPFTMGINQFDFIDYEEFCMQTAAAVSQDEVNGIINICTGRPQKLAERAERFIQENGYDIRLEYGAFPDRPYDSKAVWGDDSKIRRILEMKKIPYAVSF